MRDLDANRAVLDTVTLILTMARTVFIGEHTHGAFVRHDDEDVLGVCKGSGTPARHG